MNYKFILIFLFLPLFAGLSGCRIFREPEYRSLDNLRLYNLGASETTLTFEMTYFNPNKSALNLKQARGRVFINDNYLGQFRVDTVIRLSKQAEFKIPVKLTVDMKNVLKNSITALFNPVVSLKLDGRSKMGKGFIYLNFPIRYFGEFNMTELIK